MRTCGLIVAALLLGIEPARSQYDFSFSGYVADIPAFQGARSPVAEQFGNVTRLRLRPALSLWTNARLSLEYEVSSIYHSAPFLFGIQPEESGRQLVPLRWTPVNESRFTASHFVDRLHFDQGFGDWDIVLGRQRIAWGTGRVWNPTDLFNPINPTNFAKIEKDGVDAALVKVHLGSFTDLSMVLNPRKDWKGNNAGFRFRTNYREFDVSVVCGVFDRWAIAGGDFAGNLLDAGVRGEGIVSAVSDQLDSSFVKLILGIDYQFSSELYGLLEYHFNGEGATQKALYDMRRLANGEIINVGRNYLTIQYSYLVHPLVSAILSYTRNIDDRSQFIALAISYSASDEMSVGLGGQVFLGDEFSEYWRYPNSLYVKAELFF